MPSQLPKATCLKQRANRHIRHSTRLAILAGVVPVPGVDLILLQRLQISLIRRLTTVYQRPFSYLKAKQILSYIPSVEGSTALVTLQGVGSLSKLVPGYGLLAGISTTALGGGIGTYSLGQLLQQHLARGGDLSNFTVFPPALAQAQKDAIQEITELNEVKLKQSPLAPPETDTLPAEQSSLLEQSLPQHGSITPKHSTDPDTYPAYLQLNALNLETYVQCASPTTTTDETPPMTQPRFDQPNTLTTQSAEAPSTPYSTKPTNTTLNQAIEDPKPVPKQGKRWTWWVFLLSLLLLLLIAGSTAWYWWGQQQKPLLLGVVGPMSGDNSLNGQSMVNGAQLAVNEINRQGGVQQRRVELLILDDSNDPEKAVIHAKYLARRDDVLAVIGHYTSSASVAAAPIYEEAGLPAITGSATTDELSENYDWFFRVIFNNTDQAALIANYANKVFNSQAANIIYVKNSYGETLAQSFNKTAKAIGLEVNQQWAYEADLSNFDSTVDEMLARLANTDEREFLFVATNSTEAAKIVQRSRSLPYWLLIIGPDSFASSNFLNLIKKLPEEQAQPGYYTNEVYITAPFLVDIASQKAQEFNFAYSNRFHHAPSITAAMYYDAALFALIATNRLPVLPDTIKETRAQLKQVLSKINSISDSIEGATGALYFNKNGDIVKTIPIGAFKNGQLIAGEEQFLPVNLLSNNSEQDLLEAAIKEDIVIINGKFMRRTQVIYTGIEFIDISTLNITSSTYIADFYLWFRYYGDKIDDSKIELVNLQDSITDLGEPTYQYLSPNGLLKTNVYRFKGTFKINIDLRPYPLDKQSLPINLRHQRMTRDQLIYVVDRIGLKIDEDSNNLINKLEKNDIFNIGGWHINNIFFYQNTKKTDSTLGIPTLLNNQKRIEFSQFNVSIEMQRNVLNFVLKNLLPLVFLILLGYVTFFMPADAFAQKIGLGANLIIASSLFHLRLSSEMPNIDYVVLIEYVFYFIYLLSLYLIANTLVIHILDNHSKHDDIDEASRKHHRKWIKYLENGGRIGYPLFIVLALSAISYPHLS